MFIYVSNINTKSICSPEVEHFFSLRLKVGEKIYANDFRGNISQIEILNIDRKSKKIDYKILRVKIFNKPKTLQKILLQAIPEKLYLEKLMEILPLSGVEKAVFFYTDFCLKQNLSLERLDRILIRSCEQSQTIFKPEIEFLPKARLADLIKEFEPKVLDCPQIFFNSKEGTQQNEIFEQNTEIFKTKNPQPKLETDSQTNSQAILVGPEGGFSQKEKKVFVENKLEIINLGELIYPAWLAGFAYFQKF